MFKYSIASVSDTEISTYKKCFEYMIDDRKKKILRLKNEQQQKLSLLGEWLAKTLVATHLNTKVENLVFYKDEKGKPYLFNNQDVHFNISHSSDMAIAVISDKPIGIDIEKIREINLKLTKRVCTEKELIYIFGHIPEEQDYKIHFPHPSYERFWEIWTAKEAYFKYTGTGITNFKSVETLTLKNKYKISHKDYLIHIVTEQTL